VAAKGVFFLQKGNRQKKELGRQKASVCDFFYSDVRPILLPLVGFGLDYVAIHEFFRAIADALVYLGLL